MQAGTKPGGFLSLRSVGIAVATSTKRVLDAIDGAAPANAEHSKMTDTASSGTINTRTTPSRLNLY
jgi:hypothetical protein